MTISDAAENAILNLVYNATTWANVAVNATSSPITDVAVALHSADPTDSGNMSSSEIAYTSYARVDRTRSNASGGWAASTAGSISPHTTAISFPAGTGGSGTVTHFSTGKTGGGAAEIFWSGTVTPNIVTGNGVTPQLTTATTITLD